MDPKLLALIQFRVTGTTTLSSSELSLAPSSLLKNSYLLSMALKLCYSCISTQHCSWRPSSFSSLHTSWMTTPSSLKRL